MHSPQQYGESSFGGNDAAVPVSIVDTGDMNATYAATIADTFATLGVVHAVISPGSRSTPMSLALLRNESIRTSIALDERSGAFMALGIGRATRTPALVVTTSGTATSELHSAVVEADLAAVPLIVCTADRPPELQGVWAPQTIDQTQLFGSALRSFQNPGPPTAASASLWRGVVAESYRAATGARPGPVQLNLMFREPLTGEVGELPDPLVAQDHGDERVGLLDEQLSRLVPLFSTRRGVIIAGERTSMSQRDTEAVLALANHLRWPILADHLSGVRGDSDVVITAYDPMLRDEAFARTAKPDAVLRIGGLLTSKVTNAWLASSGAAQIGFDRFGICPDPDHVLASATRVGISEAAASVCGAVAPQEDDGWLVSWQADNRLGRRAIDDVIDGEPAGISTAVAAFSGAVANDASQEGAVFVSSSMPVRDVEWFVPAAAGLDFHANRGANGIDGVASTALGVALSGTPTLCIVGDVAMLHDSNVLISLRDRDVDFYLLVIDNDGGGIFSFLPQATELDGSEFETMFGTPHGTDFVALAGAHGLTAERFDTSSDSWRDRLASDVEAWAQSGGVRVSVLRSDRHTNVAAHQAIYQAVAGALTQTT